MQVANINNDIESSIKKVSNAELIQSLMETMPNFGLYHGKDDARSQKSRLQSRLKSPTSPLSPKHGLIQSPKPVRKPNNLIVEEIE